MSNTTSRPPCRGGVTPATPAKLRDGTWGARVQGQVNPGYTIEVRTSGGKTWECWVDEVIWRGEDRATGEAICLVRTAPIPGAPRSRSEATVRRQVAAVTRASGHRACRECGGPVQSFSNGRSAGLCHDCC